MHRYFWKQWTQKSNYQKSVILRLGLLLTAVTWGHTWTNRLLFWLLCVHVCSLTHARTHALAFESSKSPFILQNPHTLHPVSLGTLHQHTRSLQPMRSLRHTLHRGPPSPYCPFIWLLPFVPHILLVADGKLLKAGGAAGPCLDLLKNYNMTLDFRF